MAAFPRFVLHDLRLSARTLASMFGSLSLRRVAALIVLLVLGLHVAAYPVAGWLIGIENSPDGIARITAILAGGAALIFPWIVSQSMADFSRTLFGRSDLELILASPVDAHALLAARALSISVAAFASVGLLLAPLADVAALRGHPHWLALYPALLAAGLAGTGFAIILSMGLFLAAGPRRARLFGQIAATAIGTSAVLGAQVIAMLPERMRTTLLTALAPRANADGDLQGFLWTPVRAADGRSASGHRLGGVWRNRLRACLRAVWRAFCACGDRDCPRAGFTPTPQRRGTSRFGASAGTALRIKERRVVWRDPWLMSQLLLQAAYTSAARRHFVAQRRPDGHDRGRLHAGLGGDRGPTCWRAVLGRALGRGRARFSHDRSLSPAHSSSAPRWRPSASPSRSFLHFPFPHWRSLRPGLDSARFCCGAGAIASAALVNLWRQTPSRRGLVLRRHSQSKLVGMMEHLVSILWAIATTTAVIGSWATVVPLAAIAGVLALNRKWAAAPALG